MSDVFEREINRLLSEKRTHNHHVKRLAKLRRQRAEYYAQQYPLSLLLDAIEKFYRVGKRELLSDERYSWTVTARRHLCWLIRTKRPDLSYPAIGGFLGKNHTTVLHAVQQYNKHGSTHTTKIVNDVVETMRHEAGITDSTGIDPDTFADTSGGHRVPTATTENNSPQAEAVR